MEENKEKTRPAEILVIIKPGFTDRKTVDDITDFFYQRGVQLVLIGEEKPLPLAFLEELYQEHREKSFYQGHMEYMMSGPCLVGVATVDEDQWPDSMEPTKVLDELVRSKTKQSIRSLYGRTIRENVMHCSDSEESRQREHALAKRYKLI